jgi:hypothetical protein
VPLPQDGPQRYMDVQSSATGRHGYWKPNGIALGAFRPTQQLISNRFNGDPAVKDLPRVMRLPGFWHRKGEPFMVRILEVHQDAPACSAADFETDKVKYQAKPNGRANGGAPVDRLQMADAFAHLDPQQPLAEGIVIREAPPLPFSQIKEGCAWLKHVHDTGGCDQSEPLWWDALRCCRFLTDGENLIHELGNRHDGYNSEDTEAKFEHVCKDKESKDLGYPQCQTICDHGSTQCKTCPHLSKGKSPLHLGLPSAVVGVKREDFYAYMPLHSYMFAPSRELWPAASVNARIPPTVLGVNEINRKILLRASVWIDRNQPVEMMTWAPGMPMIIADRLIAEGGRIERKGVSCFNLYRPPTIELGDASKAGPWLELVHKVYPNDADHIIKWFAQRRQHPHIKINHSLFMGGVPGIGKDTILEPIKRALGAWNFKETAAKNIFDAFNPWMRAVILRINEAKDMGDISRFDWYEATKTLMAAPPDVLPCNEKHIRQHWIINCMGVVITSNHLTDGIYLPSDDRRHYVTWSDRVQDDFTPDYWIKMWRWYDEGGDRHVAAYLDRLDLTGFDPKAAPPKTPAFWSIVNANRTTEEGELQDVLDNLENPDAITIGQIADKAPGGFDSYSLADWLRDRKNRKAINHRLENCGYRAVNNPIAKDGLWRIGERRQMVYAKVSLSLGEQRNAVETLQRKAAEAQAAGAQVGKGGQDNDDTLDKKFAAMLKSRIE